MSGAAGRAVTHLVATPPVQGQALALQEMIVAAAADLTVDVGWSHVTMARLAERVGVSRQTIYNEIGSKPELAEAMVLRELGLFLLGVEAGFDRYPDNLPAALRSAVASVLGYARDNALLQVIVSAAHGAGADLLPLLTTRSDTLIDTAKLVVHDRIDAYAEDEGDDGDDYQLDITVDLIVRLVLSHVLKPSGTVEETADEIGWVASRLLAN